MVDNAQSSLECLMFTTLNYVRLMFSLNADSSLDFTLSTSQKKKCIPRLLHSDT